MNNLTSLLQFLYETEEGLSEVEFLVMHCIKYINNNQDKPASYKDLLFVIKGRIDNNWCGHSPETFTRAVRKLKEQGIIMSIKPGLFYHEGTIFGRRIQPQRQFVENKRSFGWRG